MSLRTPDVIPWFWASEENDLTPFHVGHRLLGSEVLGETGLCRSFSCRSFRMV
jgi:hypothetical protein